MNFWYSSGSNSTASARYWDSFLYHCYSSKIYMHIRAASSCSLWYLVSEVKVNLFHIWICWNFLYIMDASFSRKILLELIHFKSRNSGVTWSRFEYFPLLATFAAKVDTFLYFILQFFTAFTPYWTTIVYMREDKSIY